MKDKPNIILIIMDVQRASNIHCYGYEKETTPNIDKVAREGTVFLKCISPAVWTLPSHASIFTGRYVYSHGVGASHNYKPVEKYTLTEILRAKGYSTVGFCRSEHWWARYGIRDDRGFEEFYGITYTTIWEWINTGSNKIIEMAKKWIDKHAEKSPFFMFINCLEPHLPYIPPVKYVKKFLGEIGLEEVKKLQPNVWKVRMGLEKISDERWRKLRALYDGETACLDERLGKLFQYLEEKDLIDKTMLIITSDHGDEQGEHYPPHIAHQLHLYQPGIHVPLIIRYPDLFPRGKKINDIVQTLDIFPTILDLLSINNIDVWRQNQGISLIKIIEDKEKRFFALSEHQKPLLSFERMLRIDPNYDFRIWNRWIKALIIDKYKYIWSSDGRDELYNLEKDPLEQRNLIDNMPEKYKDMRDRLSYVLDLLELRDLGDLLQGLEDNVRMIEKYGYIRRKNLGRTNIMQGLTP